MEPHSRLCLNNGTLRLPQALVLLLKSALAGPSSGPVTQTNSDLALLWQSIKHSAYRLVVFVNPFAVISDSDGWKFSLFVGMVKLTVLCGFGSALWLWTRRKEKIAPDPQHANAVGKSLDTFACFWMDPLAWVSRFEPFANPS